MEREIEKSGTAGLWLIVFIKNSLSWSAHSSLTVQGGDRSPHYRKAAATDPPSDMLESQSERGVCEDQSRCSLQFVFLRQGQHVLFIYYYRLISIFRTG